MFSTFFILSMLKDTLWGLLLTLLEIIFEFAKSWTLWNFDFKFYGDSISTSSSSISAMFALRLKALSVLSNYSL